MTLIKWVKPSTTILTAGLKDTILTDDYPIQKFKNYGSGTITLIDGDGLQDDLIYTHNLGYIPDFDFQIQHVDIENQIKISSYIKAPFYEGTYADLGISYLIAPYCTTTEFRIEYYISDLSSNSYELDYMYKIYYELG